MSKRNAGDTAHEVANVLHEIKDLSEEEIYEVYGINVTEAGVFDPLYNKRFASVSEWAKFSVEQDDMQSEEHFHHYDKGEFY